MAQRRPVVVLATAATAGMFVFASAAQAEEGNAKPAAPSSGGSPTSLAEPTDEPVLAVKIDNVAEARPHTGLAAADLVYVQPVEAGLSRLMAMYSSELPETVGPVRSARETDLGVLPQFGEPAFAFAGANSDLLPYIAQAPVYDVSHDAAESAYSRSEERPAPHNLYAEPAELLEHAPDATDMPDIGFRFGAAPDGGEPRTEYTVDYGAAEIEVTWSESDEAWQVFADSDRLDDVSGPEVLPSTVVVQHAEIRDSDLTEGSDDPSPYVETVGAGDATVLRDGEAYEARWSRDSLEDGTTFTTPDGEPMTFAPGQVWVVYDEE